ncbi:hypothetical protein MMC11_008374 [Xylographa trunciseda]|nr:hypothetical protein [Xylographa trunciseda]
MNRIAQIWKIWKIGHQPFEEASSDTFVLATPNGNMLWTCDNAVIQQLFTLHPKVEQPIALVKFYNLWGPTISSVSGEEWKAHRRAVSAGFGNAMNKIVWEEAQHQTETLVTHWIAKEGAVIPVVRYWTSRLALHVISSGFFGKRLEWDDYESSEVLSSGHHLTFDEALLTLLARLTTVFMTPRALLGKIPGKTFKEAHSGFTEVTKYFQELRAGAAENIDELAGKRDKTILEAIVISAADPEITGKEPLPEESVLGNIFFTLLAGHETSGSTIGFIFTLLTLYPEYQERIQAELDRQLSGRPPSEWTVENDYQALQKGYLGAFQKEVLYIYNPGSFLMRETVEPVTVVDSKGQSHKIPKNTLTLINNAAAARNPAVWIRPQVSSARRAALSDSPALYFNPDRWLGTDDRPDNEDRNDKNLLAWHAFGGGGRVCPGRAFAQIEMTSVMAKLLTDNSLELMVDEKTLQDCQGDKHLAWETTRDRGIKMMYDDIEANISIGLMKELPIRVVKRNI